jgi:hypothetical protein
MSKLSITQAANAAGISRSHLYKKYINAGIISVEVVDDKKVIDASEIIRVFGNIIKDSDKIHENTPLSTVEHTEKDRIIAILERELSDLKAHAKEREEWLKSQIDELRRQHSNLLENKQTTDKPKRKKFLGIF